MRLHLSVLLLCQITWLVLCDKNFRLGRSKGGNLGTPGGYNGEPLPKPQWFKQRLDHSSSTNLRTFKQVSIYPHYILSFRYGYPIFSS